MPKPYQSRKGLRDAMTGKPYDEEEYMREPKKKKKPSKKDKANYAAQAGQGIS